MIAQVAVEKTAYFFDKLFSYSVPVGMNVQIGMRVKVPFGRGNSSRIGIVFHLSETDDSELKSVLEAVDKAPVLSQELIQIAEFMAEKYFCTYFEAAKIMLPPGALFSIKFRYKLNKEKADEAKGLSEEQNRIIEFLRHGTIDDNGLKKDFGITPDSGLFAILVDCGIVVKEEITSRKVEDASFKVISVIDDCNATLTPKQSDVYDILKDFRSLSVKELQYYTGVSVSVLDSLVKKGAASYSYAEKFRKPKISAERVSGKKYALNPKQHDAYDKLYGYYSGNDISTALLYGVTGSGKTSVFVKLAEKVINEGKNVIVLVPEISLTAQTVQTFRNIFGDDIAVIHSGLSIGERYDEWKRCEQGKAKIAIGTRSAVFAPFKNLGLIVLDEEHERSYKSENSPRYNAKEIARIRARQCGGLCLFCSATPSVDSYLNAQKGVFGFASIEERFGNAVLPQVEIIDMLEEARGGNTSELSVTTQNSLRDNFIKGKQSIVLLNRRGYHTYVRCTECREVRTCPNCSISLTYHSANNRLMCHYCGYSEAFSNICPVCSLPAVSSYGLGTQRAEEAILQLLPEAKVLRIDSDSVSEKNSLDRKLDEFAEGKYDIMIGTQMVAKGLNFENVTLVCVLNIDQMMYNDDFRSGERVFDLLTQVVGRAGRGKYPGKALIQSEQPENVYISFAAAQNYKEFFSLENNYRKSLLYPPYADILSVGWSSESESATRNAAFAFLDILRKNLADDRYGSLPLRVFSPVQAGLYKTANKYRYKLLIKCKNNRLFRELISLTAKEFLGMKDFSRVSLFIDSNPESSF
ncbi:MAG: primosomal protein N' [Clostridia bacterium]|nr:primosomal protein N' [Clostridia bacterium]